MAQISDRDLDLAHELPDNFVLAGGGSAANRLIGLVSENWIRCEIKARAELVEALLPVLEPLLRPGAEVTDRERGVCKAIVPKWLERQ